jgi:hypothetical protein
MLIQKTSLALALALAAAVPAQAALTVNSSSFNYSQSFDSLAAAGATNAWANDVTLAGWSLFSGASSNAVSSYAADAGTSTSGGLRSYGSANAAERALGSLVSNTTAPHYIAIALTNNSGAALDGFTLDYTGEQWRNNSNANAQALVLQYGFGNSYGAVGGWTAAGTGFDFSSPIHTGSAAALNGNLAANRVTGLGGSVNASWAQGQTLWLRWADLNESGSDHGLAIDNVNVGVIAAAVPEPTTYAMLLAGLGCVGFIARRRKAA